MSHRLAAIVTVCLLMLPLISRAADAPATQPAGATGTWTWSQQGPNGDMEMTIKLKQDGDKLTGSVSGFNGQDQDITDGKVQDNQVTFKVVRDFNGNQITTTYTATMDGDTLKGKSETIFSRNFNAKRGGQ
jgi:hypothetical protein